MRNKYLYRLCEFYINAVDNDHDSDFYTNGEAAFARASLPKCSVAFDLGAAVGDWTAIALQANPRVIIHCFEPSSRRFRVLASRNFGKGPKQVILNNLAMGEKEGQNSIFYGASGGSVSLFPQRYGGESYNPADVETVSISTIDQYCRQRGIEQIDFIKMDIEGYEMAAIRGAEHMLKESRIATIQFEYSYVFLDAGTSLKTLMEYVRDVNPRYDFHKIYPDGTHFVPQYEHRLDNFKTSNWAIIKRD